MTSVPLEKGRERFETGRKGNTHREVTVKTEAEKGQSPLEVQEGASAGPCPHPEPRGFFLRAARGYSLEDLSLEVCGVLLN